MSSMIKVLLILILSPLLAAETQTLTKIEDNCCQPEATFLNFESSNSVDGISFKGVLVPKSVGDRGNYTTGKGLITFIRDKDQKSFTIQADRIGFQPGNDFTNLFIDGSPGSYKIPGPIKIEINKILEMGILPLIEIKDDILKITCLWCFARGYSQQEVYKIISTKNKFDYQYLYTLPENAEWDGEDSFTYNHTGGASYGGESTVAKVGDYWYEVKNTSFACWNTGELDSYYRVWEFNEDSKTLDLVINDNNCDRLDYQND